MILYVENPKDSTPKLLELIQEFSKVAGYKINAQKSVAFLYTNNETEERETKESIPFTTAPKTVRYLGIGAPDSVVKHLPSAQIMFPESWDRDDPSRRQTLNQPSHPDAPLPHI